MRRHLLFYILILMSFGIVASMGCRRSSGIDNGSVLQTPFSLYFSDSAGALYNTNDGRNYNGYVFAPDGKSCRAICTSYDNLIWIKKALYSSSNDGRNFNLNYDTMNTFSGVTCNGSALDLNQSMIINIPSWENTVYTVTKSPDVSRNWLGVMHSYQHGYLKTWGLDTYYDTDRVGTMPVQMKSFTMLANGYLCGLAYSGVADNDTVHHRNFVKQGKEDEIYENRWHEVTANPDGISYIYHGNPSGTPLPPFGSTYTDSSYFYLGHLNNRLIAIDAKCNYGAWYSDDFGANWQPYSGLPLGTPLLCIESPFEEVCLVGTAGKGVYILNTHTGSFEQSNHGLATGVTVRSIVGKKNVYKNGTEKKYIYLATDKGLYESADGGQNWTKTVSGNFVAVY